jgi:hypothetical protein
VRSTELSLDKCDTDKIRPNRFVEEEYDLIFELYVQKNFAFLELGIKTGGSLLLWRDYFLFGTIAGIDIKLPDRFDPGERIHIFEGDQADSQFLSQVANKIAPEGFDIIIDDSSHIGELTKLRFGICLTTTLSQMDFMLLRIGLLVIGAIGPMVRISILNPTPSRSLNGIRFGCFCYTKRGDWV